MSTNATTAGAAPSQTRADDTNPSSTPSLISPVWDFFGLGGFSLFVVPFLLALPDSATPIIFGFSMLVAHFINHPHFANSYQIFYRGLGQKLSSDNVSLEFRLRYVFAGFVVPAVLFAFFLTCYITDNVSTLGIAVNLMGFFVGWHYVKQGYGMIIVQSVLKKQFLSDGEKKILMYNAYAMWAFSWCLLNHALSYSSLWGIEAFLFNFSVQWVYLTGAIAATTTVAALVALAKKATANAGKLPWTGVVSYMTTLYIWLFASFDIKVLYLVPALHSLQYLTVVWRYQLNYVNGQEDNGAFDVYFGDTAIKRYIRFLAVGGLLGYFGFWALPRFLNDSLNVDTAIFGTGVFLFICWVFINLHHYFLDNVMWRKENPETGKHLFAHNR